MIRRCLIFAAALCLAACTTGSPGIASAGANAAPIEQAAIDTAEVVATPGAIAQALSFACSFVPPADGGAIAGGALITALQLLDTVLHRTSVPPH